MASVFVSWRDVTYEKVGNAGEGGIGKVAIALATTGPRKGVLFAIKVFSPGSREKEEWKQAFMREVHVLRDCDHPAIVRVFDEGVVQDGRPFFVMEYLPATLWAVTRDGKLNDLAKLSIVMQLLSALDYLSRRDPYVVHRDIKPKNIFLKDAELCVLGDFGLIFQDVEYAQQGGGAIPAMARKCIGPRSLSLSTTGGRSHLPPVTCFSWVLWPQKSSQVKTRHAPPVSAKPIELEPLGRVSWAHWENQSKTRLEDDARYRYTVAIGRLPPSPSVARPISGSALNRRY